MLHVILRRLPVAMGTLITSTVLAFLLVRAIPSTPGAVALGATADDELIRQYNENIGWFDPLILQYLRWLGGFLTGDMGVSFIDGRDIWADLLTRLPVTVSIAIGATLISAIVGLVVGVLAAVRGGVFDRVVAAVASISFSIPGFWLGILLIYVFALVLPIFPATGYVPLSEDPAQWARSVALPIGALAVGASAAIARVSRTTMIEALNLEHIRTLRALGTPQWRIFFVHALRYASVPVVAMIGMQFAGLLGGSVLVEQLFILPGIGAAAASAVSATDAPVVQGIVVFATLVVVVTFIAIDLVTAALDPKVRAA
jgi:peptide/nickel transport system permease protein